MHELALKDIFRGMREGQKLSISFFENCGDVFDLLNERLEMKIQEDGNGNGRKRAIGTCKDMQDALRVVTRAQLRATSQKTTQTLPVHALALLPWAEPETKLRL